MCAQILIERLPAFHGCFNARISNVDGESPSPEAYLCFHGFPAIRGFRNQDIAEELCWNSRANVYILHYRGLGKISGNFSFQQSTDDSVAFAKNILQGGSYSKIHIFGHSWGGWVAMNVAASLPSEILGKIVLLSPLNFIPEAKDLVP